MKTTQIKINSWENYDYPLNNQLIVATHIESALKSFWIDTFDQLDSADNYHIRIQFKFLTTESEYRSLSYIQTVNHTDLERLINNFKEYWDLRNDDYHNTSIKSIVFTYKILFGKVGSRLVQHKKVINSLKAPFKFGGFKLPTTMDITKWSGNIKFDEDYSKAIVYINKSPRESHVSLFNNYQEIKIVVNNDVLLEFRDTVNDVYDLSSFTRTIKNQTYIFVNGKLVIKQIDRKANFLNTITKDESLSENFITMDLETRTIEGKMQPYCVSTYYEDGIDRPRSFYLSDYTTPEAMMKDAVDSLLTSKFDGYKVYLHNFSNFDAVFLIRILSELGPKIRPVIRDGRIINIALDYGITKYTKYTIYFRDSYLLLSNSLKDLAKNFNVENKGLFPYSFVNDPNIKLNYLGLIPDIKYFNGITVEQYDEYCKTIHGLWSLEYQTKYYCELDCMVLYKVIKTFSKQIFELFKLDINKYPTLPSLALAIYRSNFLKDNFKISLIDGTMYNDLKKGYSGGMVDVYKPTNEPDTKVFSYDVNSLYPYTMRDCPMPIGTPKYFEGDISKVDPNAFGIFQVEIQAPDNLKYPVLQTKVQTPNGNRTIAPLGNWTGWYFSAEIYNAIKYGYKFNILRGYIFNKGFIFTEYVDFLYKLKANSTKGTPNYLIAKLLLNSLDGKFGMDPENDKHVIINSEKAKEYHNNYIVTNIIDLGNNKELISYYKPVSDKIENNKPSSKNISVPVALAITAYARIHMSVLKKSALSSGLDIFYMDTDSLSLNGELDPKFIGTELGKLKLEHVFNEVIYLAPKVYAGKTDTYEYVKIKGLKNPISFDQMKPLLNKDESLKINQDKW